MKTLEKFAQKLLVEGINDYHVMLALCKKFDILENFDVLDCGNDGKVLEQIPVRLKTDIETLGIILDADQNINQRWQQLRNILAKQGFEVGDLPENGLILQQKDKIRVGVWLMPNNSLNGMLEDFMAFLVPSEDKLMPLIENYLKDIETKGLNLYKDIHRPKTKIHAWLAVQQDAGKPLGQAITAGYLNTDEQTCLRFVNWLKTLFGDF